MPNPPSDARARLDRFSEQTGTELLVAEGFDDAVVGVGRRCGQPDLVVYSIPKAVECLVRQGLAYEEAVEYLEFNTIGAWVGEQTPVWLTPVEDLEV